MSLKSKRTPGQSAAMRDKPRPRRAYVAMSGGGARGLLHIGAIGAIEERNYVVLGWAGTSIGAIFAALAAAGFRANDLVDPERSTTILSQINRLNPRVTSITDLFGRLRWIAIKNLRRDIRKPARALLGYGGTLTIMMALIILASSRSWVWGIWLAVAFTGLICALAAILLNGFGRLRWLKEILRRLLQERMFPEEPGRIVRMSDFGRHGRPTLKIVAANLTTKKPQLFSPELTPDVDIADAVVASIALPVVFRLPRIRISGTADLQVGQVRRDMFADGGIVSNLPAWPFDEERAIDPHVPTLAFELVGNDVESAPRRLTWPMAFLRTGLFGSGELNLRAANGMVHVPLDSQIGLLDFDLPVERVFEIVSSARLASGHILDQVQTATGSDPFRMAAKNLEIHEFIRSTLSNLRRLAPRGPGRIKVATALKDPDLRLSMRLQFSVVDSANENVLELVPREGFVLQRAVETGQPSFFTEPLPHRFDLRNVSAERRKALKADARWYLVVPVSDPLDRSDPCFVLATGTRAVADSPDAQLLVEYFIDRIRKIYQSTPQD
jgi:NTE family protein